MQTQKIPNTDLEVTRIAYGCMPLGGSWDSEPLTGEVRREAIRSLRAALDQGVNFFDHADIYCRGKSEEVFSAMWKEIPHLRQQIILQSKCGIRFGGEPHADDPSRYDFSYEHIVRSVEGSLKRLQTDRLDVLLLHRPDPLVEPEEVARAFDELHQSGKVRYFGVSNHTAAQMRLLRKFVRQPILFNQVQFSLLHTHLLNAGIHFNQDNPMLARNEDTIEYCRQHEITLQAWGPLSWGLLTGRSGEDATPPIKKATKLVAEMAEQKGVSGEAILIAWILRHPAKIQAIIGTTRPERIAAACQADGIVLSREEWYRLFVTARGEDLP